MFFTYDGNTPTAKPLQYVIIAIIFVILAAGGALYSIHEATIFLETSIDSAKNKGCPESGMKIRYNNSNGGWTTHGLTVVCSDGKQFYYKK